MVKDTSLRTDPLLHGAEQSAPAAMVIRQIERAGYTVYLTHHSGAVVGVAHGSGKPRVVVGTDRNGDRYAAAVQAAGQIGLSCRLSRSDDPSRRGHDPVTSPQDRSMAFA